MGPVWPVGVLVVGYAVATLVQGLVDSRRDITAPFRGVDALPEAGPGAWTVSGGARRGAWGALPGARVVVTEDWIGMRIRPVFGGVRSYLVDRADVAAVVVVAGLPQIGASIGVRGRTATPRLAVQGTDRRTAEAELDRLGWPHERARPRLLRPFR